MKKDCDLFQACHLKSNLISKVTKDSVYVLFSNLIPKMPIRYKE